MGRKRKVLVDETKVESTTAVLRPEAKPELAKASVETGDIGYDAKGVVVTNASEMVAEKVRGHCWVMCVGADLFNPRLHSLKSTQTFNKPRRVSEDCFNSYLLFLKTGNEVDYRLADKKAVFAT